MALADTARLIASLELQDKFSRPLAGANRSLSGFERNMGSATRATRGLGVAGVAVGTALGTLGARAVAAGIRGLVGAVTGGVAALHELENVTVATRTVLASTQGVSGQTEQSIRDLAEEYENLNATIDDKVIQSGANMLLTFTNIREDGFEPALEAALNLNEAMGGGEEGLQGIIIKVGRALNDPIRGLNALTRAGVTFDDQQREQIRTLQESGDLLGAQQVILEELGVEFGGRFAAAGDTAAASQAALHDRIEDVQKSLAGPLIPAMDRVRERLIDLLGSPRVLAGAEKLGEAIAGLFSNQNIEKGAGFIEDAIDTLSGADFSGATSGLGSIVSSVAGLPWASIGDAARLLGTGAKAMLDAFLGLPPWVQTAVLTGWGLNKLTGGALSGIIGELGKGLIKGVLGMNAGVVNINAGIVNGGGGGVPGGRVGGALGGVGGFGGAFARGLGTGTAIAAPVVLTGLAVVEVINFENMRTEARAGLQGILDELPRTAGSIDTSIARIDSQIAQDRPLLEGILFNTNVKPQLEAERAELVLLRGQILKQEVAIDASIGAAAQADHQDAAIAVARLAAIETSIGAAAQADRTDAATAAARLTAIDSSIGSAAQSDHADAAAQRAAIATAKERIAAVVAAASAAQTARTETVAAAVRTNTAVLGAKNFAPDIHVTTHVTSNVSISEIQRRITSQQIAMTTSSGLGGGI